MLHQKFAHLQGVNRDKVGSLADAALVIIKRLESFAIEVGHEADLRKTGNKNQKPPADVMELVRLYDKCMYWIEELIEPITRDINVASAFGLDLYETQGLLLKICGDCLMYAITHGQWIDYQEMSEAAWEAVSAAKQETESTRELDRDFCRWEREGVYAI